MDPKAFLHLLSQFGLEMDEPRVRLLTEMLAQTESANAPAAAVEEKLARKKKTLAKLERLIEENRQLWEENRELQERLDSLAEALGACAECWGEDPACRRCRGRGRPGYFLPDEAFLLPLLRALPRQRQEGASRSGASGKTEAV